MALEKPGKLREFFLLLCVWLYYGPCPSPKRKSLKPLTINFNEDYWEYLGRTKYEMNRQDGGRNWKKWS